MTKNVKSEFQLKDVDGNVVYRVYVDDPTKGLRGASFDGLNAEFGQLQGLDLSGANLYWATLRDADLSFASFVEADLRGSILQRAICKGTNFRNAQFGCDNLGGATDLRGADLSTAILDGAVMLGALYDGDTKFPPGFSPDDAGMTSASTHP